MGINVTHVKDTLLADGVNKVFPFTFPVMDKADVKCLYVLPSGEETDLLAAEYEVRLTDTGRRSNLSADRGCAGRRLQTGYLSRNAADNGL